MGFGNGKTLEVRQIKYSKNGYIKALLRGIVRQDDEFKHDFSGWTYFLGDADKKAKEKSLKEGDYIKARDINVINEYKNGVTYVTYFCYSFDFLHENDDADKNAMVEQGNNNPIPF